MSVGSVRTLIPRRLATVSSPGFGCAEDVDVDRKTEGENGDDEMAAMEWKDQYDDCDEPGGDDDENDNDNPKPDWATWQQ